MGRKSVVIGVLLPLLLVGVIPFQLALPAEASPNPIPVMSLGLNPSGVTAHPTDVGPGAVSLEGYVSIDKIPGERFPVYLNAYVDTGWAAQCSPTVVLFTNNKMISFSCSVVVPQGTRASDVGVLRVEALARNTNFVLRAVGQAIVAVCPFYKLYLDSPLPYKEVTPGSSMDFVLTVINMGNSVDTFDLAIQNQDELAAKGWMVSFSTSAAAKVGPGESKSIRMFVQTPMVSTLYKVEGNVIMVQAISQNSRDSEWGLREQIFPFVVYERGTYIDLYPVGLSVVMILLLLTPFIAYWRYRRNRRKGEEQE